MSSNFSGNENGASNPDQRCHIHDSRTSDIDILNAFSRAVTTVVETVAPAVVSIIIKGKSRGNRQMPAGAGSGVVIAPDGYILTNSHVILPGGKIEVHFTDGQIHEATVVGSDNASDLAIVSVPGSDYCYGVLGNSDELKVGQVVIAIGNPMGFDSTVSTGVVSSLGRALRSQDGRLIENIVQHTAPLNPGNSGGPLVNSSGQIVGINTAIIAMAQGIGFSIPSNTASWVLSQIMAHGKVRRGYLGIAGRQRPLNRKLSHFHNLENITSVEVVSINRGAPAEKAGMRVGDLIVEIEGNGISVMVQSVDDLHRFLSDWEVNKPLMLTILRGKDLSRIQVVPEEAE